MVETGKGINFAWADLVGTKGFALIVGAKNTNQHNVVHTQVEGQNIKLHD